MENTLPIKINRIVTVETDYEKEMLLSFLVNDLQNAITDSIIAYIKNCRLFAYHALSAFDIEEKFNANFKKEYFYYFFTVPSKHLVNI